MAAEWPHAGQRVDVQVDEEDTLLAVVDDVRAPEQLHLRLPLQRDGSPPPEVPVGSPVAVAWTSPAGRHVLPSTLVGLPEARVPLWKLAPQGAPEVLQRREFVRVPETLRVTLRTSASTWPAGLCDLSEGGARCVVTAPCAVPPGTEVQLDLSLDEHDLVLQAVVLAAEPEEDRVVLRLQFQDLRRVADVLRRRVVEQQRRARAWGLR